tara:strand:- start:5595 stop:7568 length:1974 start_codon:yes stop_codon:yes gene_type:complete
MVIEKKLEVTSLDLLGSAVTYTSEGIAKSYLYSDTWDYTGSAQVANIVKPIISFKKIRLEFRRNIQETLNELKLHGISQDKIGPSWSTLDSWKIGLIHIAESLESTNWAVLDDDYAYRAFRTGLKGRNLSKGSLEANVIPALNRLQASGFFNRIIDGRKIIKSASAYRRQQHIAVPTRMYREILNNSIKLIETYHPYKDKINEVMQESYSLIDQIKSGLDTRIVNRNSPLSMDEGAVWGRVRSAVKRIEHDIPNFKIDLNGTQIGEIQTACMIVILSFSGMRLGEACSLNLDSYKKRKLASGIEASLLKGKSSKGNDGKPKSCVWVTHSVTKDALELVHSISKYLRVIYNKKVENLKSEQLIDLDAYNKAKQELNSSFLAIKPQQQTASFSATSFASRIKNLANKWAIKAADQDVVEFDMLNPTRKGQLKVGGNLQKLTPHDFRRSFAVFFVRHGFGTASGIKFQYKHQNINMAGYYSANAELASMEDTLLDKDLMLELEEAGIDLGVDIFDEIYNKSENLSGVAGENIMKEKEDALKQGQKIYMNRSELEVLVRNGSLSAVMLPGGGYCTNENCDRVCSMFSVNKAKCQFEIIDDKGAKVKATRRNRLVAKFEALNDGDNMKKSILVAIKQEIQLIEQTLFKHGIQFKPFTTEVAV